MQQLSDHLEDYDLRKVHHRVIGERQGHQVTENISIKPPFQVELIGPDDTLCTHLVLLGHPLLPNLCLQDLNQLNVVRIYGQNEIQAQIVTFQEYSCSQSCSQHWYLAFRGLCLLRTVLSLLASFQCLYASAKTTCDLTYDQVCRLPSNLSDCLDLKHHFNSRSDTYHHP